jgi:hypothetical protein
MSLVNGTDIMDMSRCMGLDDDQKQFTYGLDVGNAIVRLADRYTRPFWIHVPPVTMDKDVSNDEIGKKMGDVLSGFGVLPVVRPSPYLDYVDSLRIGGRANQKKEVLTKLAQKLLSNVSENPFFSVTRRYDKLGLSRKKGKVVKDYLLEKGLVSEKNVRISNVIFNFLLLTEKGLAACEASGCTGEKWREIVSGNVSFLHRFYQFFIKEVLTHEGWDVFIEHKIGGDKWVDVVASYQDRKKVAFEVAITKFEPDDVLKCMGKRFDEIRVVCKDEKKRKRIEKLITGSVCEKEHELVIVQTINGFVSDMPKKA